MFMTSTFSMLSRSLAMVSLVLLVSGGAAASSVVSFESAPVRPMAQSVDGQRLYVANTPDGRLEVYDVDLAGELTHAASVPVGMDPVAVAVAPDGAVWVVNHLSDSVSVVAEGATPAVVRTLLVGDEPRDIVFAQGRAFVTTAHRGQHRTHDSIAGVAGAGDPQLHSASVARADVWVFDAAGLGGSLGGTPVAIVELFGDTPRALAVSPDGATVYAAVFNSGNQTSVVHEAVMCRGFEDTPSGSAIGTTYESRHGSDPCVVGNLPFEAATASPNGPSDKTLPRGRPLPSTGADGEHQPWTSMIVRFDRASGEWRDSRGLNYSNGIRFYLPDHDVFAIDALSLVPTADFEHVGTTLFNMAVNPRSGTVYVANTDAQNHIRFEGPGIRGGSTVQGNIAHTQITVIDPVTGDVEPRHLNRHIDYAVLKASASTKQHTISTPLEMQVSSDGEWLYVAAIGSDRVAVYSTADLENDALWNGAGVEFDPTLASANHIDVAGGPAGLLLDEGHNGANGQLYVLTHFDNGIAVIDASTGALLQSVSMHNPEPPQVVAGRRMLYDARRSSSNGESSCASCHVFGDMDHLSWNLGNPDGGNTFNPQPFPTIAFNDLLCDLLGSFPFCELVPYVNGNGELRDFASMKGPMMTQTMRGMSTHGHLHWRGDRANGYFGIDTAQTLDEKLSFKNFIVAFEGLLGLDVDLPAGVDATGKSPQVLALERDIDSFADFMLRVQLPPNPIRPLDNSHSASAQIGDAFFDGPRRADGLDFDFAGNGPERDGNTCEGCHNHDPFQGFYGTDGEVAHGGEVLVTKVPHFRNLYQKVGMFGLPNREFFLPSTTDAHQGDQIRGFGFLHDGATDKLFNFLQGGVFDNGDMNCEESGLAGGTHFGCELNDGASVGIPDDTVRQGLVDYLMEFDSDLAPIVGQQITLDSTNSAVAGPRIDLLLQRAQASFNSAVLGGAVTECDLIAKGVFGGVLRGAVYDPVTGLFRQDREVAPFLTDAQLRARASSSGQEVTYTCVPPGSGVRAGIDRDDDGVLDGDDPTLSPQTMRISGRRLVLKDRDGNSTRRKLILMSKDPAIEVSGIGDPTVGGAVVRVVNPNGNDDAVLNLPAENWAGLGNPAGSKGYRYKDRDGVCRAAKIKPGRLLKVVCRGAGIDFSLDEPTQGALTATFQAGRDRAFCMEFGGRIKEKQAIDGKSGLFLAKDAPVVAVCDRP